MTTRTAAQKRASIRRKLVVTAHNHPEKRAQCFAALERMGFKLPVRAKTARHPHDPPRGTSSEFQEGWMAVVRSWDAAGDVKFVSKTPPKFRSGPKSHDWTKGYLTGYKFLQRQPQGIGMDREEMHPPGYYASKKKAALRRKLLVTAHNHPEKRAQCFAALERMGYTLPPGIRAKAASPKAIGSGSNGYIAWYKGKQLEVRADDKLEARDLAAAAFRARRPYDVEVMLAEKGGKQVTHMPMFANDKTAAKSATVGMFLTILASRLTRFDQQQEQRERKRGRGPNIYRLGHYLKAVDKARKLVGPVLDRDDEEAIEVLRSSLRKAFIFGGGKFDLPPVRQVEKMMDKWLTLGKAPRL